MERKVSYIFMGLMKTSISSKFLVKEKKSFITIYKLESFLKLSACSKNSFKQSSFNAFLKRCFK